MAACNCGIAMPAAAVERGGGEEPIRAATGRGESVRTALINLDPAAAVAASRSYSQCLREWLLRILRPTDENLGYETDGVDGLVWRNFKPYYSTVNVPFLPVVLACGLSFDELNLVKVQKRKEDSQT